jgi:hypothetical protein
MWKLTVGLMLCCTLSWAQAPADAGTAAAPGAPTHPTPPKPSAELEKLKLFTGEWKCDGKMPAGPMGPAHDFKATMSVRPDVDSYWYAVRWSEVKSAQHPQFKAFGYVGYDESQKQFVRLFAASFGSYEIAKSLGWEGERMVWSGELNNSPAAPKVPFRHTFTQKGKGQLEVTFEMQLNGQWTQTQSATCRK